jgi:hypothetical protein
MLAVVVKIVRNAFYFRVFETRQPFSQAMNLKFPGLRQKIAYRFGVHSVSRHNISSGIQSTPKFHLMADFMLKLVTRLTIKFI